MKWDFTPEQVAGGEVSYTVQEFRSDLFREVSDNFPDLPLQERELIFNVAYDVCYCVAVRHELTELLTHLNEMKLGVDLAYLEMLRDANADNIAMLKAIFAAIVNDLMHRENLCSKDALERLGAMHRDMLQQKPS